jgi:hypothetical protein
MTRWIEDADARHARVAATWHEIPTLSQTILQVPAQIGVGAARRYLISAGNALARARHPFSGRHH